jgi:hypothetical protein
LEFPGLACRSIAINNCTVTVIENTRDSKG